jgi:hypothetical protein
MPILSVVIDKLPLQQQIVFKSLMVINDNSIGDTILEFSTKKKDGTNKKTLTGNFGDKLVAIKRYYQSVWEEKPEN